MEMIEHTVASLGEAGVVLWVNHGQLGYHAPAGFLSEEDLKQLRARRDELVGCIVRRDAATERDIRALELELPSSLIWNEESREVQALCIRKPWQLQKTEFDFFNGTIEYHLTSDAAVPISCPTCGIECTRGDEIRPQRWRRVAKTVVIYVTVNCPKGVCPRHGDQVLRPSWLKPVMGFSEAPDIPARTLIPRLDARMQAFFKQKRVTDLYANTVLRCRPALDRIRLPIVTKAVAKTISTRPVVKLPLDQSPAYKAYHSLAAHPLGILGSATDVQPLLASDYINIACSRAPPKAGAGLLIVPLRPIGHFVGTGDCEIHDIPQRRESTAADSRRVIQALLNLLDQHWYVFAHVNKYYIPGTWWYLKKNYLHDCLLVGFDMPSRVFYVAMYTSTGEYEVAEVPFARMAMALTIRGSRRFEGGSICYEPAIMPVRPTQAARCRFDPIAACRNLRDYLLSQPPDEAIYGCERYSYAGDRIMAAGYPVEGRAYGVEAFHALVSHLEKCVEENWRIDLKDTRALCDHKKILQGNIRYWCRDQLGVLPAKLHDCYAIVPRWAQGLHHKCFAFNADGRRNAESLLTHLKGMIRVAEIERQVLSDLALKLGAAIPVRVPREHPVGV